MSSITAGQSVEVVYQNKDIIGVQVNLLTGKEDYVLHFNPRYSLNILVLNTLLNGTWQAEIRPGGFPFPANYASSRVAVRITAQQLSFAISVNGVPFTEFPYRSPLTPDKVRTIQWGLWGHGGRPVGTDVFESVTFTL